MSDDWSLKNVMRYGIKEIDEMFISKSDINILRRKLIEDVKDKLWFFDDRYQRDIVLDIINKRFGVDSD